MDVDTLETRADSARGPFPGEGRSAWRPWRGIVEKTPCLWVTWLTEACKRLRVPMPRRIEAMMTRVAVDNYGESTVCRIRALIVGLEQG